MSKKDLALILLSPAILAAIVLWQSQEQIVGFILGPSNDPGYFCGTPDPSPVADLGTNPGAAGVFGGQHSVDQAW